MPGVLEGISGGPILDHESPAATRSGRTRPGDTWLADALTSAAASRMLHLEG